MGYVGVKPSAVPLTSADITDGIITSAKIADGTIVNADINASAAIASTKLSGVQGKFESQLLHVRDEKGSSAHGGTSATSYTKRDLNTSVTNEISGASLASDQITLPSGTYYINASAPGYSCERHTIKLRNTTDSTDTILGTSEYSGGSASTNSKIIGRFTISAQKVFEIQHKTQTVYATLGLGVSKDMSETNIYTNVQIWKVA
jgi:hypothetical protein